MSDREQKIKEFKALDDISHVLTVPSRYIGSVNPDTLETYLFKDNKFIFENVSYTPGMLKIIEEILDNSVDAYLNSSDRKPITIKVNITKTSVEISDTGSGIPVVKYKDETGKLPELNGKYLPELAWGRLKSGGSFKEHRVGSGTHGEGSSLTNIFSKKFIGTTDDGKHKCKVSCLNNMRDIKTTTTASSGKSGTTVYFEPDLQRFNLTEITQVHVDLLLQRIINLSISFPALKFYFNGERVLINAKNFINMFSEHGLAQRSSNTLIGVFPSSNDEFQQYSYVNGLRIKDGGVHIDYIINKLITPIKEKLERKYKNIKPADIKNHLALVVFLNDFANPQFHSQTKDQLRNPISDVSNHISDKIDFDKLVKEILKNDAIINPIIDMFKLKEELKARQELKKVKKIKVKSDKYMSPIGEQKYLALVEGNSAASGLQSSLGRDGIGYFACRGLPINAYSQSIQKIVQNEEFKTIMSILNMDVSSKESIKNISFNKILIATDSDADGAHLTSMFLGWFKRFGENLFHENKICKLNIPLVLVIDKNEKVIEHFFNLTDFNIWEKHHSNHKYHIEYWKGLGSISK
jgi:DNA topoisomerase-2